MILAWIATCGVRMSSPRVKAAMFWIRLRVSVMMSELDAVSGKTLPRPLVRMPSRFLDISLARA